MAVVSMKQLLEAGVHFGHQAKRWNPKMKKYIFTERNGIHVIDLHKSLKKIEEAYEEMRKIAEFLKDKDFEKYLLSLSSDTKNKDIFKGIINDISFDDSNLSLNYSFTVNISSKYTQDLLKKLGFEWPKTDDIYLRKLIEYMKKVKFI